ncbi:MAG TPA: glycosyltransferase [Myxococcales bacterium]|nr:glycosyltransferase [Myxococcales bacterium]
MVLLRSEKGRGPSHRKPRGGTHEARSTPPGGTPVLLLGLGPGAESGPCASQGSSLNRTTPPLPDPSVLLVLPDLSGGGAERTSLNVRQKLCGQGRNVRLALLEARGEYLDLVSPDDYVLPSSRPLRGLARLCPPDSPQRALAQIPLLMGLLRREAPDVLMSSMADVTLPLALAFAWMPGRRRATRWIAREGNNTRVVIERAFPNPRLRRPVEKLIRWAYRSADVCLAISPGVAQGLVDHYDVDPKRIRIIANPVDLEGVRAGAVTPLTVNLPPRFIVGVGRLAYQKGFDLLIDAFSQLDDPGLDLVLVGSGPEEAALKARAEALGLGKRVHFPGFVEHPSAILARAEIFCLSSRWEGFGHVIVEAMASGCPVVVTDCEYGPADIVQQGENGILVAPDSSDALAAGLKQLLLRPDEAKRLATRALVRAEDFSVDTIAASYWDLFAETEASP